MKREFALALVLGAGVRAWGQTAPSSLEPAIKDAPYSREMVVHYEGSGTDQRSSMFRDSRGRIRTQTIIASVNPGKSLPLVTLTDASAGRICFLNSDEKVAHCFSSIPVQARLTADDLVAKDLGTKVIEGVQVEGKRYTSHSMLGLAMEVWTSPELQIDLESSISGHGFAMTTTTTSLRRGEPDASLFEVPPDYKVTDAAVPTPAPPPAPRPGAAPRNGSPPKPLTRGQPAYTDEARRNHIEGAVALSVMIGADGVPTDIRVTRSLDPGLDQSAVEAVRQWRWEPAQMDGKPIRSLTNIVINFRLDKRPSN